VFKKQMLVNQFWIIILYLTRPFYASKALEVERVGESLRHLPVAAAPVTEGGEAVSSKWD
jgi:hypothetical protein